MKRIGYKTMKPKHRAKTNARTYYDALPTLEEAEAYLGKRYFDEEMEEFWNSW